MSEEKQAPLQAALEMLRACHEAGRKPRRWEMDVETFCHLQATAGPKPWADVPPTFMGVPYVVSAACDGLALFVETEERV